MPRLRDARIHTLKCTGVILILSKELTPPTLLAQRNHIAYRTGFIARRRWHDEAQQCPVPRAGLPAGVAA